MADKPNLGEFDICIEKFRTAALKLAFLKDSAESALKKQYERLSSTGGARSTINLYSWSVSSSSMFLVGTKGAEHEEIVRNLIDCYNRVLCDSIVALYESHEECIATLAEKSGCSDSRRGGPKRIVDMTKCLKHLRSNNSFQTGELNSAPGGVRTRFASDFDDVPLFAMREVISELRHAIVHEYGMFDWDGNRRGVVEKSISGIADRVTIERVDQYASLFWRQHDAERRVELVDRTRLTETWELGFEYPYEHLFNVIVCYTYFTYESILSVEGR